MVGHILISELVKRARSFLGGQHELHSDVKQKLERLGQLLLDLQCVIQVTEGRGIQNPAMVQRLKEFKTLAYQIDNLLDTFEYRELEWKSSSRMVKGLRYIGNVAIPKQEFGDLTNVVKKLEILYSPVKNFVELVGLDQQSQQRSITPQLPTGTPRNNEHSFVGRKEEKEKIINFLLNTESHSTTNVPVLLILGAGGIGKTALAQEVYNDENVKRHFSLKMWVCVSKNFDLGRLTREMLNQLNCSCDYIDVDDLVKLKEILKMQLSSDKFLLVLDNVWSETLIEVSDMVRACAPLCHQNEGSKILFTSREEEIAGLTKHEELIKLKGLRDDEYRSFFLKCAFGDANLSEHPELEAIGKQIACKLNGSPLAAKTVGELLKDKLREDHWRNILNSDILEQKQDNHDIMPALRLSYLYLPFQLKQCFSYLCVTPKAWELFQKKVIGMWMAQSMVCHDDHGKRVEDVGEDYFKMLISKSFFQKTTKEDVYILHDLLHDLAEKTHKGYSFRIEDDQVKEIPSTVQHLSVSTKSLVRLKKQSVLNNLRTLLFLYNNNVSAVDADLRDVLKQLGSIRVLSLSYCSMDKLPCDLRLLFHLRYLDLSHSGIKELPDEVTKLYLLQILDLSELEFDRVPKRMNKLINLRSLICSGKILSMIAGIGKMARLQELKCPFSVQVVPRFDIGQLGDLEELRGCLCIRNLENVNSGEKAREARLCEKGNLVELVLQWGSAERNTSPEVENEILEGLEPHGKLKKLCIDGYKGTRSPSWMVDINGLTNLVSLKLIDCKAWENLPPLGQLLQLQVLEISRMHAIKNIHHGIHGSGILKRFPSLQELIFDFLPEWEVWSADDIEVDLFPCLKILRISDCPKLTTIPPLPSTIQSLELLNVGLGKFPKLLTKAWDLPSSSSLPSSLVILTIKGCQQLQYPSKWLIEQHESLRNLEELTVDYCDEFAPELVEAIGMFTGLKKFSVEDGGLLLES
ncbi:putative disease resistance RPP13-like protein 1 [Typha angustifolia]|uniref:putative disease resistance RPP13-like protein 1 n=1 Tax=Typha angustifolia TaxID=59011 RepID=UPI003C2E4AC9